MPEESDIDADLIARYRASARGTPDVALDRSILGAAHAAAWRRRNAWVFASAAAACAVLAVGLASIERAPAMPFKLEAQTVENQLRQARTRAFLLDAQALRESALTQQPGATARPGDLVHP